MDLKVPIQCRGECRCPRYVARLSPSTTSTVNLTSDENSMGLFCGRVGRCDVLPILRGMLAHISSSAITASAFDSDCAALAACMPL